MKTYLFILGVVLLLTAGWMYAMSKATDAWIGSAIDLAASPATVHRDGQTIRVPANYDLYRQFNRDVPDPLKFRNKELEKQ